MEIPEFTCLCPMTGQPDFATLVLDYVPDRLCVELKSLKLYVWSYRDEGAFHEAVTNRILDDLVRATKPRYMRLEARFNVRGGIYTSVSLPSTARRAGEASALNPLLARLQPYPFEKLRALIGGNAESGAAPINLSIGEPKHPTPRAGEGRARRRPRRPRRLSADRRHAGAARGDRGLARAALRHPGAGSGDPGAAGQRLARGAVRLRADGASTRPRKARVVCPNPFYQIYEGAALLAGATPVLRTPAAKSWDGVQLVYACSPANPSGKVMSLEDWKRAVRALRPPRLHHRLGRVLLGDLLRPGRRSAALEAARQLGRDGLSAAGRVLQPVQALQRARACARASSPATPRC